MKAAQNKPRYFKHRDGFGGEIKTLGFFENGEVIGYDNDGAPDPDHFTGFYDLSRALDFVGDGTWVEIERPIKDSVAGCIKELREI